MVSTSTAKTMDIPVLSDRESLVITRRDKDKKTYVEIGREIGVIPWSATRIYRRAKKKMRVINLHIRNTKSAENVVVMQPKRKYTLAKGVLRVATVVNPATTVPYQNITDGELLALHNHYVNHLPMWKCAPHLPYSPTVTAKIAENCGLKPLYLNITPLTPRMRQVLELKDKKKMTLDAIGEVLHISSSTVYSMYQKAKKRNKRIPQLEHLNRVALQNYRVFLMHVAQYKRSQGMRITSLPTVQVTREELDAFCRENKAA